MQIRGQPELARARLARCCSMARRALLASLSFLLLLAHARSQGARWPGMAWLRSRPLLSSSQNAMHPASLGNWQPSCCAAPPPRLTRCRRCRRARHAAAALPAPECERYYVQGANFASLSCEAISKEYSLPPSRLQELNPGLLCGSAPLRVSNDRGRAAAACPLETGPGSCNL